MTGSPCLDEPADHIGEVAPRPGRCGSSDVPGPRAGGAENRYSPLLISSIAEFGLTRVLVLDDAAHLIALRTMRPYPDGSSTAPRGWSRPHRGGVLLGQSHAALRRSAGACRRPAPSRCGRPRVPAAWRGARRPRCRASAPGPRCARRRSDLQILGDLVLLMPDDDDHVVDVRLAQGP